MPLPAAAHPEPLERLTMYAAVHLFIERALAVRPDFHVTNESAPAVAAICVRLDGLPLAIELAAARIRVLTPQALLARLDHRLKLLTGGGRDQAARHQTLRGAIQWSWDLLTAAEQALLRRLGVFVGGWSLEAAEAVCDQDGDLGIDVLDGLTWLVEKSLVRQDVQEDEGRFSLLETIREFALERLEESGEQDALRARHAAYFAAQTATHGEEVLSSRSRRAFAWLRTEQDNLRAALADLIRRRGAQQAGRMKWHLVYAQGIDEQEKQRWFDAVFALSDDGTPSLGRAMALLGSVNAAWVVGDTHTARAHHTAALALLRELGPVAPPRVVILARLLVAFSAATGPAEARAMVEEGLELARRHGDRWMEAWALHTLGIVPAVPVPGSRSGAADV